MPDNGGDERPSKRVRYLSPARDGRNPEIPQLRDIAPERPFSSTHLQDDLLNNVDDYIEKRFPGVNKLARTGGEASYSLPTGEPGQPQVITTQVERTGRDTVKISRASTSAYFARGNTKFQNERLENPVVLSKEQMTPRAAARLLPPLQDLSHDDYLQRAGKTEHPLSNKNWERAVEQVQNNYPVSDIASNLKAGRDQVEIVQTQVKEIDPASIAVASPPRSATPESDISPSRSVSPESKTKSFPTRPEGAPKQMTLGSGKAATRAEPDEHGPARHAQAEGSATDAATRRGLNPNRALDQSRGR
jgi:hypothetical protein